MTKMMAKPNWGPFVMKTMVKPKAKLKGVPFVMKMTTKPKGGPFVTKTMAKQNGDPL